MENKKRTFQETYFWVFAGCIILTIILDYFNVSVKESTEYATGVINKTVENVNQLILWAFPTVLVAKKVFNEWTSQYFAYKKDIEAIRALGAKAEKEVKEVEK